VRTVRISARVSPEEYEMIAAYARAVDRDMASLVRHAVMSMLRRDQRRVAPQYITLLESEGWPVARTCAAINKGRP